MTLASKITVSRIVLIPVFVLLAWRYGQSVTAGEANESLRWWALAVFLVAAASDGVDGWIARHFNQKSDFGAFIDPIADKVLVAVMGYFGQRLVDMAGRYRADVVTIERPWGEAFSLEELEQALISHKPAILAMVHAETSTGVCQPMEGIGELCRQHDCLLLLDTVTSLGAVPLLLSHRREASAGLLWLNGAETYVDVEADPAGGPAGPAAGGRRTHWFSESGVADLFLLSAGAGAGAAGGGAGGVEAPDARRVGRGTSGTSNSPKAKPPTLSLACPTHTPKKWRGAAWGGSFTLVSLVPAHRCPP